jgi:hypothetical protein
VSSNLVIHVDIISVALATIPLWLGLFAGCWVLLRILIFRPLNEISLDLKDIKTHLFKHDERLSILETKVKILEGARHE